MLTGLTAQHGSTAPLGLTASVLHADSGRLYEGDKAKTSDLLCDSAAAQ